MNKIKGIISIDITTFLLLSVLILVSLSSFGLGRLSVSNKEEDLGIKLEDTSEGFVKGEIGKSVGEESIINSSQYKVESSKQEIQKEKMYVASKNGKLYYTASCSGAKRISEKNRVWFASASDAEKSGYTLSSSCK